MQLQNFALKFLLKGKKTSFYQNTTDPGNSVPSSGLYCSGGMKRPIATLISTHRKLGFFQRGGFFFQKQSLQVMFTRTENMECNEK